MMRKFLKIILALVFLPFCTLKAEEATVQESLNLAFMKNVVKSINEDVFGFIPRIFHHNEPNFVMYCLELPCSVPSERSKFAQFFSPIEFFFGEKMSVYEFPSFHNFSTGQNRELIEITPIDSGFAYSIDQIEFGKEERDLTEIILSLSF